MSTSLALATRPMLPAPVVRAVRDILPLAAATLPFGGVVGIATAETGVDVVPAALATFLVYAGSAQLATMSALTAGGGLVGAVLAGAIINSRLLLYAAGHAPRFRAEHPTWFRWLAPLLTIDFTYLLGAQAHDLRGRRFRQYWLTMGLVLGLCWTTAVAVGMRIGSVLPPASPLEVVAPAAMTALLVPHVTTPRMGRVIVAAAVAGALASRLPGGLGIVLGITTALLVAGPGPDDTDHGASA